MTQKAWRWSLGGAALLLLALPVAIFWIKTAPLAFYFSGSYPPGQAFYIMMRPAGHLAFTLLFLQITLGLHGRSLASLMQVRSLLELHKAMAIPTLGAAILHPLLFACAGTLRVGHSTFQRTFFPNPTTNYWTWYFFFGALACYGMILGALAAIIGPRLLPRGWRWVHALNYLSFGMAWYHCRATGAEVREQPLEILYTLMAVAVAGMLAHRIYRLCRT